MQAKENLINHVGVFSHVSSEKTSMINPQKEITLTSPSSWVISRTQPGSPTAHPSVKTTSSAIFPKEVTAVNLLFVDLFEYAWLAAPLTIHFPIIVASLLSNPLELRKIYLLPRI